MTINYLKYLGTLLLLLWALANTAWCGQKSVLIGFTPPADAPSPSVTTGTPSPATPDAMDLDTAPIPQQPILPLGCIITRRFTLIPAVAALVPEEAIPTLLADPNITYVEANAVYSAATSNASAETDLAWQVTQIEADVAHQAGVLGTGVKVAVLDTGIDYTHEDLNDNYLGGCNFVFPNTDPLDDSRLSHGTHVAGIIAAERNGLGIVGVAPEAKLYAVKVLDGGGFGSAEWIVAGIEWAVAQDADVINMSLAGPDTQALRAACEAAHEAGVLLVAAGGNSLAGGGAVRYPAAYRSVIAVTGTDAQNIPGNFAPIGTELQLAAPGVGVVSTTAGGNYNVLDGTSQAAACVSGAAALFLDSLNFDLNLDGQVDHRDVRTMMELTATDLGPPGGDEIFGFGLVNLREPALEIGAVLDVVRSQFQDPDTSRDQVGGVNRRLALPDGGERPPDSARGGGVRGLDVSGRPLGVHCLCPRRAAQPRPVAGCHRDPVHRAADALWRAWLVGQSLRRTLAKDVRILLRGQLDFATLRRRALIWVATARRSFRGLITCRKHGCRAAATGNVPARLAWSWTRRDSVASASNASHWKARGEPSGRAGIRRAAGGGRGFV